MTAPLPTIPTEAEYEEHQLAEALRLSRLDAGLGVDEDPVADYERDLQQALKASAEEPLTNDAALDLLRAEMLSEADEAFRRQRVVLRVEQALKITAKNDATHGADDDRGAWGALFSVVIACYLAPMLDGRLCVAAALRGVGRIAMLCTRTRAGCDALIRKTAPSCEPRVEALHTHCAPEDVAGHSNRLNPAAHLHSVCHRTFERGHDRIVVDFRPTGLRADYRRNPVVDPCQNASGVIFVVPRDVECATACWCATAGWRAAVRAVAMRYAFLEPRIAPHVHCSRHDDDAARRIVLTVNPLLWKSQHADLLRTVVDQALSVVAGGRTYEDRQLKAGDLHEHAMPRFRAYESLRSSGSRIEASSSGWMPPAQSTAAEDHAARTLLGRAPGFARPRSATGLC